MEPSYILNGQAFGSFASQLVASKGDPNYFRPYIDGGNHFITHIGADGKEKQLLTNTANGTLTKDAWKLLDDAVTRAAKPRLRAWGTFNKGGLKRTLKNGMGKTVMLFQNASNMTGAQWSMDALRESERDRPVVDLNGLPLPIISRDFSFSAREILVANEGNFPIDTTSAEMASEAVAIEAEKMLIGVGPSFSYGGYPIYGLTNFPSRNTKTLTDPTPTVTPSWTPTVLLNEILAMKYQSQQDYMFGPWMLFNSPAWDQYLDDDYSAAKGDNTLRERIQKIDGISGMQTLDYLTGLQIIMVQMTSNVVQCVTGMPITTVQWESHGGMQINFKVMAIMVPLVRADFYGNCGIVHGSV